MFYMVRAMVVGLLHFPRDVHGDVGHNHAGNTGAFAES